MVRSVTSLIFFAAAAASAQAAPPQPPQPPGASTNQRVVQHQVRRVCTLDQNGARHCNDLPPDAPLPASAGAVGALEKFGDALKNGRMNEMQSFLAPEVQIHEGGKIENRSEYLAGHADADAKFLKDLKVEKRERRATTRAGRTTVVTTDLATRGGNRYELKETAQLRQQGESWVITELRWDSKKL